MNKDDFGTDFQPSKGQIMPGGVSYENFWLAMNKEQNSAKATSNWRRFAFFCLLITALSLCFNYWQSTQAKLLPYIIEVDQFGSAKAVGLMSSQKYEPQEAEISYFLGQFIYKLRSIPTDKVMFRKNAEDAYLFLTSKAQSSVEKQIRQDMDKVKNGDIVSVELVSITKAGSDKSYHLRWVEKTFSNVGILKSSTNMFGIVTIKIDLPKDSSVLMVNPLGIYIDEVNWSKES